MKTIKIAILNKKIHMDEGGATLPEMIRVVSGLVHNLSGMAPKVELQVNWDGSMIIVTDEKPPGKPGVAAKIEMYIDDSGFVSGGKIDHNGQREQYVIDALNYLYHIYAKEILHIGKRLLGADEKLQELWFERIINENDI